MKNAKKSSTAIFSVKPKYASLIFAGEKKVELRKTNPRGISKGSRVFFWESSPSKQLAGTARVISWIREPLDVLWDLIWDLAGVSRDEFNEYFKDQESGVALFLEDVEEFAIKPKLSTLRRKMGFQPPQSFRYVSPSELKFLVNHSIT